MSAALSHNYMHRKPTVSLRYLRWSYLKTASAKATARKIAPKTCSCCTCSKGVGVPTRQQIYKLYVKWKKRPVTIRLNTRRTGVLEIIAFTCRRQLSRLVKSARLVKCREPMRAARRSSILGDSCLSPASASIPCTILPTYSLGCIRFLRSSNWVERCNVTMQYGCPSVRTSATKQTAALRRTISDRPTYVH